MRISKVIIIGGRGTAVVVAEQLLDAIDRFGLAAELIGFAFDDESLGGESNGIPIVCNSFKAWDLYGHLDDVKFLYQMYRPDLIKERVDLFKSFGIPSSRLYTFVHPSCTIARSAEIGCGSAICANTVINPNAKIGKCVTINSSCLVGHDSEVQDYTFVAGHSAIGSNAIIHECNFIGLNSTVRNFVSIKPYSIVGAASNVVKNVDEGQVVYGNPASVRYGLGGPVR